MKKSIQVGIVGMGGYAFYHHKAIEHLEQAGEVRLVCTCDPQADSFASERATLRFNERGVRVFSDFEAMLAGCAGDLDLVVVSTPIPLHLEMHRRCIEAGVACYLEKPPTLDYRELAAMIETDRTAPKQTLVGFNYIAEPSRLALKQRLLDGEFGRMTHASLVALWRRSSTYFQRSDWAGRLKLGDKPVLDSCFGNAMSHFVHNMLFWLGREDLFSWGEVTKVQAALYRAHAIEGADTFFVEATAGGVPLRCITTHACSGTEFHEEALVCERATIRYAVGRQIKIQWHGGREEDIPLAKFPQPEESHRAYLRYLRGEVPRPITTLADCLDFVNLNDLAYVSSQTIDRIPAARINPYHVLDADSDFLAIAGLEADVQRFVEDGIWPTLTDREATPPLIVTPKDLPRLSEVIDAMILAGGG
jgi:predicted dehydrogenase